MGEALDMEVHKRIGEEVKGRGCLHRVEFRTLGINDVVSNRMED